MDYPTAIAIAIPMSTFIVTVGVIFFRKSHGRNPNSISRKDLDVILKDKLEGIVHLDVCDERVKRIEMSISMLKLFMKQEFTLIKKGVGIKVVEDDGSE